MAFGFALNRLITVPIVEAAGIVRAASQGDLTQERKGGGEDEIGTTSRDLTTLPGSLRASIGEMMQRARSLNTSAESLHDIRSQMSDSSGETVSQANMASAPSEEISATVSQVCHFQKGRQHYVA